MHSGAGRAHEATFYLVDWSVRAKSPVTHRTVRTQDFPDFWVPVESPPNGTLPFRYCRAGDDPLMTKEEGSVQLADAAWTQKSEISR